MKTVSNQKVTTEMVDWVVEQAFKIQRETEPHFSANMNKVRTFVEAAVQHPSLNLTIVTTDEGDYQGFMMGTANAGPFVNNIIALDVMMHVVKKYRAAKHKVAITLLEDFERWATEQGATACFLLKAGRTSKFNSKRHGYTAKERHAIKFL